MGGVDEGVGVVVDGVDESVGVVVDVVAGIRGGVAASFLVDGLAQQVGEFLGRVPWRCREVQEPVGFVPGRGEGGAEWFRAGRSGAGDERLAAMTARCWCVRHGCDLAGRRRRAGGRRVGDRRRPRRRPRYAPAGRGGRAPGPRCAAARPAGRPERAGRRAPRPCRAASRPSHPSG
ncbi:hypothetical protein C1N81_00615 (plasmid) [Streptomyces sp. SGAir0957]